jgi:hypothetical protein
MEGPRFDAWTRRRFGLAAGGFVAATLGVAEMGTAGAKRTKKKRCRKLGKRCRPGRKPRCCGSLRCGRSAGVEENPRFCCKTEGKPCQEDVDCCDGTGCAPMTQTCTQILPSDRALKANFGTVDAADMLARVAALPITTWNYRSDDPTVRHIGPMAQDFAATFGVGADDRHIHPLDGQGVALAAIQGLLAQIETLQATQARLTARLEALERGNEGDG